MKVILPFYLCFVIFSFLLFGFVSKLQASTVSLCTPLFPHKPNSTQIWLQQFETQTLHTSNRLSQWTAPEALRQNRFPQNLAESLDMSLNWGYSRLEMKYCKECDFFEREVLILSISPTHRTPEQIVLYGLYNLTFLKTLYGNSKNILKMSPYGRFLESFLNTFIPYNFEGYTYSQHKAFFHQVLQSPLILLKATLLNVAYITDADLPFILNLALDPQQKPLRTFIAAKLLPRFSNKSQFILKSRLLQTASPQEKEQLKYLFSINSGI